MTPAHQTQSTGTPRRLIILAQFDPKGGLPEHVRIHLKGLRDLAARLVLVSNSPLNQDARTRADAICDKVIERTNTGWDFAAWRDALMAENMNSWDSVILTNSSIVGPMFPLLPIVERMETQQHDFWGMVHSLHRGSHLQSYFLAFSAPVIHSEAWQAFWSGVRDIDNKREVINRYETRLTGEMADAGFTFAPLIPTPRFPRSIGMVYVERSRNKLRIPFSVNYVNRTVQHHYAMLEQGMPYLKASLLWGKDVDRCTSLEQIKAIPGIKYPWDEIGF